MANRTAYDTVDGGGLYFSHAVTAGPLAFFGGVAADESGSIAPDARVEAPYNISPRAHVVSQTEYLFSKYKARLEDLGATANDFVQVEQHIPYKKYADGYLDTSRGPEFMAKGRPTSALLETGELLPHGAVINPTGIAVLPDDDVKKEIPAPTEGYHGALTLDEYGDSHEEEGPFNEIATAGGWVFTVDIASDWAAQKIPDHVRVNKHVGRRDPQRERVPAGAAGGVAQGGRHGPREPHPPERVHDRHGGPVRARLRVQGGLARRSAGTHRDPVPWPGRASIRGREAEPPRRRREDRVHLRRDPARIRHRARTRQLR